MTGVTKFSKVSVFSKLNNLHDITMSEAFEKHLESSLSERDLVVVTSEIHKGVHFNNRLANVVSSSGKKISTDTVIDYLDYLKESWLIFPVENICAKLAEKESNKKYYFIDNGILNLFLVDPFSSLLENQVAIQLRRLYGDDVYFYHHGLEVDFYIPEKQMAVQVCYSLLDTETLKREINALIKMSKRIEVKNWIIITKDEEKTISEQGIVIEVVPLWKWLC